MSPLTTTVLALPTIILSLLASPALAFSGDLTYYTPGLGACGSTSTESDAVVALAPSHFGASSSACGKTITLRAKGKSATATVVDKCMGCDPGSIDVSPSVFRQVASLGEGRVAVTWDFS